MDKNYRNQYLGKQIVYNLGHYRIKDALKDSKAGVICGLGNIRQTINKILLHNTINTKLVRAMYG